MYYLIYIFTFFAVVAFFNYHQMLSDQLVKLIFYGISAIALLLAATDRRVRIASLHFPHAAYYTMMAMIVISPLMSLIFHAQPITDGITTVLSLFFGYAWFYILLKFNISPSKIITVMLIGCALSVPIYILNVQAAPGAMFGEEPYEALSRGVNFRIYVFFIELFPLMLFLGIERFKTCASYKLKAFWLFVIAVSAAMIIASVIRQIIAVSFLLALVLALWGLNWRKKIITCAILATAAIIIVPKIKIFQSLSDLNEVQAEYNDQQNDGEDIRIQAWKFYTYQFQENAGTMIFGNGIPSVGKTQYGNEYKIATDASECYEGDVGWAGFFYYFGLIATVALAILLIKTALKCNNPRQRYLAAWFAFVIITAVASGPILYTYQVFNLSSVLYLAYARKNRQPHGNNYPQLQ